MRSAAPQNALWKDPAGEIRTRDGGGQSRYKTPPQLHLSSISHISCAGVRILQSICLAVHSSPVRTVRYVCSLITCQDSQVRLFNFINTVLYMALCVSSFSLECLCSWSIANLLNDNYDAMKFSFSNSGAQDCRTARKPLQWRDIQAIYAYYHT